MRPRRLDDVVSEVWRASLDLRAHLAVVRIRRLAIELRYREDQPRAPRGNPEGGQWIRDTIHPPNTRPHVEAVRRRAPWPRCDGINGGCESGGSFGTTGMFKIRDMRLCWACAVKWLGIEEWPRREQLDTLKKFDQSYEE